MGLLRSFIVIFLVILMSFSIVGAQVPPAPPTPGGSPGSNTCPTIHAVEIEAVTSGNIIPVVFYGFNDPDGDKPIFKVELFVNGLKVKDEQSDSPRIEINHQVRRGDNIGVIGKASDGICDSSEYSPTTIVQNSAPVVSLTSNSPKKSGEVVTFTATATDEDGDTLYYSFDFGDKRYAASSLPPSPSKPHGLGSGLPPPPPPVGGSSLPQIPQIPGLITLPSTQNTATHTYTTKIDPSYYTVTVYVTDGTEVVTAKTQVYIGTGTPPAGGCAEVNNLNVELKNEFPAISWNNPRTYDKLFVCALDNIGAGTDLTENSAEFKAACNKIDLPGYSETYTDLFVNEKRFYKIGAQCGSTLVLTKETLGYYEVPLQTGLNEISTPFRLGDNEISVALSSLGTGKGINNLVHNCGYEDYVGNYSSVMHFNIGKYVSSLKAPIAALKEATMHYVPGIDCRYYQQPGIKIFDLETIESGRMYVIDLAVPDVFKTVGHVQTSKEIEFFESPEPLGKQNHREQWFGITLPYSLNIVDLPSSLISSLDYISLGNKIHFFGPTGPKDFDKLEPGLGYRLGVKQDVKVNFEHK